MFFCDPRAVYQRIDKREGEIEERGEDYHKPASGTQQYRARAHIAKELCNAEGNKWQQGDEKSLAD